MTHHKRRFRRVVRVVAVGVAVCSGWLVCSTFLLVRSASPELDMLLKRYASQAEKDVTKTASEPMRDAVVAAEDGNFYQHAGVDWAALWRALRVDCRAGRFVQGGSTISMQAVRYNTLPPAKTLPRKCAQIWLACSLERRLSKTDILQFYLSHLDFGLYADDIASAARLYFDKRAQDLDLSESAFLAGILSRPPRSREQVTVDFAWSHREQTLQRMQFFFPARYTGEIVEQARRKPLVFAWQRRPPAAPPGQGGGNGNAEQQANR